MTPIEFKANNRKTSFVLLVFLSALLVATLTLPALVPAPAGERAWLWVPVAVLALVFAPLIWILARQAFDRRPVVTLSDQGISSPQLGEPIAWQDLDDAELQTIYNACILHMTLKPTAQRIDSRRFGIGRDPSKPRINLHMLKPADRETAFDTIAARLLRERAAAGLGDPPSVVEAGRHEAFEARLLQMTPRPWALYLVVAINVGVWLVNLASGLHFMSPDASQLFVWGANSASAVVHDQQYWRLLTAMFLHGGLLHLALNMLGLWDAGRELCRWFGNAQFLLIYFGAGLTGSALSLHFSAQQSVSVGASGAVFGVIGGLVAAAIQHRERLPKLTSRRLVTGQGVFVAYALFQGFGKQGIDNAAHVGGLLAGAAIAWLLVERIDESASERKRQLARVAAALACGAAVVGLVLTTPRPGTDHRLAFEAQATLKALSPELGRAERALKDDATALKAGRMTHAQFIDAMHTRHVPAYRAIGKALAPLQLDAADPMRARLIDVREHNRLMTELMTLEVRQARGEAADMGELEARLAQLDKELTVLARRINERRAEDAKQRR